ncbi:MAG TPA: ABC transporter substrate-binding protein [Acetobacteraceae bacterium]|nr:ABC transporter substrate-binding protein [Acetobacteraceae bacterium]
MRGRAILLLVMVWSANAAAAQVVDATGRTVQVPDHIVHVVPAGPPAAVLLEAIAPDLMAGWPFPVTEDARALLPPDAAKRPQIPRVTGHEDVSRQIDALKPDLILDYGTVAPRYADLARATQQRTGIPTILLDGSLAKIPDTFRELGGILHRQDRGEMLAKFAEALLALPIPTNHPKVLYARGADGLLVGAPNTDVTEVFTRLGWHVLAPDGQGAFRPASIDAIKALDPDMLVFADPAMRETIARSAAWKTVRAVREGHALVAPSLPFGWIEEPPSVNRLIGLAWLSGRDPVTLAALSNAVLYSRTLTSAALDAVLADVRSVHP